MSISVRRRQSTTERVSARTALALLSLTALLTASIAIAAQGQKEQPPAPGTAKDFVIPKPARFTLANGLPVTMVPFGNVPKVTVRLVVDAANVHEGKNEVWLADLTGNMMREGTTGIVPMACAAIRNLRASQAMSAKA